MSSSSSSKSRSYHQHQQSTSNTNNNGGRTNYYYKSSSSSSGSSPSSSGWKRMIRTVVLPLLPPPVTKAMYEFDLLFATQVGPDASITVGSGFFIAWILWVLLLLKGRHLLLGNGSSSGTSSRGRALVEDNNKNNTEEEFYEPCKAIVVLCGPCNAGKTRMFYQLCYGTKYRNVPTLSSMKANVGTGIDRYQPDSTNTNDNSESNTNNDYSSNNDNSSSYDPSNYNYGKRTNNNSSTDPNNNNPTTNLLRYVDWPGRATFDDPNIIRIITEEDVMTELRIVVVLDSTQSVIPAAEILYELLDLLKQRYTLSQSLKSKKKKTNNDDEDDDDNVIQVLIACNKKDLLKAKNHRRIKIQMRTELEKLLAVQAKANAAAAAAAAASTGQGTTTQKSSSTSSSTTTTPWWPSGKPLDTDNLQFCKLRFISTTCTTSKGMSDVLQYCSTSSIITKEK